MAAVYVARAIPGVFPFYAFIVFRPESAGDATCAPCALTVLVANLVNACLNWVFIYGNLGRRRWAWRLGLATTIAAGAAGAMLLALRRRDMLRSSPPWRAEIGRDRAAHAHAAPRRSDRRAVSARVRRVRAVALLMGVLGTAQMAAHQIAINLASLTFMVPLGVSTAAAVLVGHAIGAATMRAARRVAGARMLRRRRVHGV